MLKILGGFIEVNGETVTIDFTALSAFLNVLFYGENCPHCKQRGFLSSESGLRWSESLRRHLWGLKPHNGRCELCSTKFSPVGTRDNDGYYHLSHWEIKKPGA